LTLPAVQGEVVLLVTLEAAEDAGEDAAGLHETKAGTAGGIETWITENVIDTVTTGTGVANAIATGTGANLVILGPDDHR
jgi:hypothetical protein